MQNSLVMTFLEMYTNSPCYIINYECYLCKELAQKNISFSENEETIRHNIAKCKINSGNVDMLIDYKGLVIKWCLGIMKSGLACFYY